MSLLSVEDLVAGYGPVRVLHGVSFDVEEGQTTVMLGANGAGKTTTLRALSGMIPARGRIVFDGKDLAGSGPSVFVRHRIAHVPQGRGTFMELTVEENLRLGAYARRDKGLRADMDNVFGMYPRLAERRTQEAGRLSGGEQQMLAIGRALMLRPRLLLLDEPSLGLAPIIVQNLFKTLGELKEREGTTMLMVEQNANIALDVADQAFVLETGTIALSGVADEIRANDDVRRSYLGY